MLPNVTARAFTVIRYDKRCSRPPAVLAGMAVQVLVYIRTLAISGRSKYVRFGLGLILLLGFPVQTFGIVYHVCYYPRSWMPTAHLYFVSQRDVCCVAYALFTLDY